MSLKVVALVAIICAAFVFTSCEESVPKVGAGELCESGEQCDEFCLMTRAGGICSMECMSKECPPGYRCFALRSDLHACLKTCSKGTDCPSGFVCDQDKTCWQPSPSATVDASSDTAKEDDVTILFNDI